MFGNLKDKSVKIDVNTDEPETKNCVAAEKDGEDATEITPEEGSKEDLLKKIERLTEESKCNYDKYLRSQAEIENIIKRNKKDKEEWYKYANEALIKELLQVIDNLENALNHPCDENSYNALVEGVGLTLKGLKDTLVKSGLTEIKTLGEVYINIMGRDLQVVRQGDINKTHMKEGIAFNKAYPACRKDLRPVDGPYEECKDNNNTEENRH